MDVYKIEESKIKDYTNRNNKRVFKILSIALLFVAVLFYFFDKQLDDSEEFNIILSGTLVFVALINWLSYLNNKKLTKLSAENLVITIDDTTITRKIDLDHEPRMNILHKIGYNMASGMSSGFYSKVNFDQLKSIEMKKGDLWVKSTLSNVMTGDNIVLVPQEIEKFEEIKALMESKLS